MKKLMPFVIAAALVRVAAAQSVYPNIEYGDTVTLSGTAADTAVTVAGTLVVPSGAVGAQVAATTVTFGSPSGSVAPAEIRVTGGKFGNSHGSNGPTTVNLGDDGGSGRFLVTGGELGVAVLNVSANAAADGNGYIDYARVEGGTARFRTLVNNKASSTARLVVAGKSTIGPAHGWYPLVYSGTGAFEVASENGAPVYIDMSNLPMTWNTAGTVVRFTGNADFTLASQNASYVAEYRRGLTFANNGAVTLRLNSTHRFEANGIIGSGVTNLYIKESAKLTLDANTTNQVRDVTGESTTVIRGNGVLEADASARDIAINVPFGGSVTLRKTGSHALTLGALAASVSAIRLDEGVLKVSGSMLATNLSAAAGTSIVVDGGILIIGEGPVSLGCESISRENGGFLSLRVSAKAPPTFRSGMQIEVDEYILDGVPQPAGTHALGGATIVVPTSSYPFVGAGQTVTIAENHADTDVIVNGHLIVTGGTSATGYGTVVHLGSPLPTLEPAVIEVLGGTFGYAHSSGAVGLRLGEDGGNGRLLAKGGVCAFATVSIAAATATNETGYIDYARVEGGTLRLRSTANDSSYTGRIVVASSQGWLGGEHGWGATTFTKGAFVIESENGADIRWQYTNQHLTFNSTDVPVVFRGDGSVTFHQEEAATFIIFNRGCRFDNAGWVAFNGLGDARFTSSGILGENVAGLALKSRAFATFYANRTNTVRNVTATDKSCYVNGSGTLILDSTAQDVVFGATVRGDALKVEKRGAGAITFDLNATNLPHFAAAEGGDMRILGELTTADMTIDGRSDILVDGGRWTVGPGFSLAAGTIAKTNCGSIVVMATSSSAPSFPAGAEFDANEYWLDGVRQEDGTYTVGGATVHVATFDESGLVIWTNESDTQTDYTFAAGSSYLGMLLKTPPSSLSFEGGDLTLGSSGITVNVTEGSALTNDFNLPIALGASQQWNLGPSTTTFRGPISPASGAVGFQTLDVRSTGEVAFRTTNSTFCGNLVVTAQTIRVSGENAFGSGSVGGKVTLKVNRATTSSPDVCRFEGATVDQPVTFSIATAGNNNYGLVFAPGTTNVFKGFVALPQWTYFGANGLVVFEKGFMLREYTRQYLGGGATVIIRDRLNLGDNWGSRGMYPSSDNGRLSNKFLLDANVEYSSSPMGFCIEFDGEWHMLRDYCFTCGYLRGPNVYNTIHLNGHPQRVEKFEGIGNVSSTNAPAFLELSTPPGYSFTNRVVFAGHAGVKMVGGGEVVLKSEATSDGSVEVESGVMELDGTWLNASAVSVSGAGVLKIGVASGQAFGPTVSLRLSGTGGIEIPENKILHVGEFYLNGSDEPQRPGLYGSAQTGGLVRGGSVQVGEVGTILMFR